MSRQHVIPVGDSMKHIEHPECACYPTEDAEKKGLWIHHAKDCREAKERQGKHLKPWRTAFEN